ncbi:MAG: electron transfer flavoprotein beta subunit/FixA family protein, partial [Bacteroidetes bacterium]
AIRIDAEPTDAYFVANQITEIAKQNNYDLILMGRESTDYNGGQVHGMVGQMLDIPSLSPVMKLEITGNTATLAREIEGGKEYMEANLPLVLGCQEPIAEWKIPNMKGIMSSRTKPLVVITPTDLETLTQGINYELPAARSGCKFIAADQAEMLIDLLRNEAKVI